MPSAEGAALGPTRSTLPALVSGAAHVAMCVYTTMDDQRAMSEDIDWFGVFF